MGKYPECFPENFETEILPKGAQEHSRCVYRIIKYDGEISRKNFMSTYEEVQLKLMPAPKGYDENDPSTYATSCNLDPLKIQRFLELCMKKYHPKAFVAVGATEGSCGVSQLTSERTRNEGSHVDWWIYADAEPHRYFKKVE